MWFLRLRPTSLFLGFALGLGGGVCSSAGAEGKKETRGTRMDYGAAFSCSVLFPPAEGEKPAPVGPPNATPEERARIAAMKGLVLRLPGGDGGGEVSVCYDLDTMKLVAAWTGGWLDLRKTNVATYKGHASGAAEIAGKLLPLADEAPVPGDARYLGLHRTADGYALRYAAGGKTYVETPRVEVRDGTPRIARERVESASADAVPVAAKAWPEVVVAGKRGEEGGAYAVDTVPMPEENPWHSWMRLTGLDFLPDGRAAVCTMGGEVWLVSGLDDGLAKVAWKRFATGLYEPLGLVVAEGKVLVRARDRIVRLHDWNADGEADYHESVNSDMKLWPSYHAFTFDLQKDSKGNLYYVTGGNSLPAERPWYARLYRMKPDGSDLEEVASGFRAPNGLTIAPDDTVRVSDNQGHWVPSSKISKIVQGGFYGHVADPRIDPKAEAPAAFEAPQLYLPMTWDSSSGGGVYCTSERWGPLKGAMIHTSFSQTNLFAILEDGKQAAATPLPLKFESGILRARFAPHDGQLWVAGLKGWQTRALREGCLQRVRHTGAPQRLPVAFRVEKAGIAISFSEALDRASVEDVENIAVQRWNYQWHATYGSPEYSIEDPKKKGRDAVAIRAAKLSKDGKTLHLEFESHVPAMQFIATMRGKFADGTPLEAELAGSIVEVPRTEREGGAAD